MSEYFTLHQAQFDECDIGIKNLFNLKKDGFVYIESTDTDFKRNFKNTNQIEIDTKPHYEAKIFVKFNTPVDAYTCVKDFVMEELNLDFVEGEHSLFNEKNKSVAFKIFYQKNEMQDLTFRGLIYVTTSNIKPKCYVAFNLAVENEYDKELYGSY